MRKSEKQSQSTVATQQYNQLRCIDECTFQLWTRSVASISYDEREREERRSSSDEKIPDFRRSERRRMAMSSFQA